MSQKILPGLPPPRKKIARKMRTEYIAGDQIGFVTKSFTKNDGTEWRPTLDVKTGEWSCDCPAATFNPKKPCKHCVAAAEKAEHTGEAKPGLSLRLIHTCCFRCMTQENLFPMAHDDGSLAHDVFVCFACSAALRREYKQQEIDQLRAFQADHERCGRLEIANQVRQRADRYQSLLDAEIQEAKCKTD